MNDLFDFNEYIERLTHVTLEKVNETTDELIVGAILPFARSVEYRINKEALKQAIRMYYGKENVAEVVRCKNCKYCEKFVDDFGVEKYFCGYFCGSQETEQDGYCYRGRKNEQVH